MSDPLLTVTPAAASTVVRLHAVAGLGEDWRLRIGVQPGGCAGLRYQVFFDDRVLDGDLVQPLNADAGQVDLVIDRMSATYLAGAVLDHHDTIDRQGFTLDNPNAQGTCSCGDSFH